MSRRTLLKAQLIQAWTDCIEQDYPKKLINGERALQACLYHRLASLFECDGQADSRRILIEPSIRFPGADGVLRQPDMVICDTRKVIGIVELKFHPRGMLSGRDGKTLKGGSTKDLHTLLAIAQDVARIESEARPEDVRVEVRNQRYLGPPSGVENYALASNLLLAWAGIYKRSEGEGAANSEQLGRSFEAAGTIVKGGFLELHSRTSGDAAPSTQTRYSGWKSAAQ